jgi:tripartite-type tricarboxylate transporter receptor subunit TctC
MHGLFGRVILLGLALLPLQPAAATAQDYPSRTITIIVPLAAGTGMDIIARLYGEQLSQRLGKPVIIENKPGAGFLTATQSVIAAPPDGHTLMVAAPANLSYNQILYKQLSYDPEKDLAPISHYLTSPFILVVNPALPVKSVLEFIQYAKAQPAPLTYSGPAGVGVPAFAVEEMAQRFGLKFNHVPYRSSPQSILDIATGQIHFAFAEAGASQALIHDGKLRALAVSSVAWHMLVTRAGTPKPILERLNAEMKRIMGGPAMQQRMSSMGLIPLDPPSLDDTDRYIKAETAKWRRLLTAMGLAGSM